jgi:hypothetical protein
MNDLNLYGRAVTFLGHAVQDLDDGHPSPPDFLQFKSTSNPSPPSGLFPRFSTASNVVLISGDRHPVFSQAWAVNAFGAAQELSDGVGILGCREADPSSEWEMELKKPSRNCTTEGFLAAGQDEDILKGIVISHQTPSPAMIDCAKDAGAPDWLADDILAGFLALMATASYAWNDAIARMYPDDDTWDKEVERARAAGTTFVCQPSRPPCSYQFCFN